MVESDVDLLSLRSEGLSTLIGVMERMLGDGDGDGDGHGRALATIAELAVDDTVRLVRHGSRAAVLAGGTALSDFLLGRAGRAMQRVAAGAYDTLRGLLPVLTAASSPASSGGEELVLRSWNGRAHEALKQIAAAAGGVMARAELRRRLNVSESYLSHLLSDLEGASLVERVGAPGRRDVQVHLAARGRAVVAPRQRRVAAVTTLRSVSRPGEQELQRRLDALDVPGGPTERFLQSTAA